MNMQKVTDALAKNGVSHRLIAPHVMQIHWLVDGSSQPVLEYDVKHNFTRFIGQFRQMKGKDKVELKSVVESLKMVNVH
jgi:hypothetical protein